MNRECVIRQGIFERWFIFHRYNVLQAWSGSKWVDAEHNGIPRIVQICNFETEQEAIDYCAEHKLQVTK